MSNQNDYVPVQLIIKIGNRLLEVDGLGHQVYSAVTIYFSILPAKK